MPNETRATRYHRARLQAGAGAFLVSLLVLLAFGHLGLGPALAALLHRLVRGWPLRPTGWRPPFSRPSSSSARTRRGYPFDRYREWTLEGRYGLARLSSGRWTRTHLRGIAARITLGIAAALLVTVTWRQAGEPWWLVTAIACYLAHLAWTVSAPLLLAAFGGLRAVRRPSLAARLDALVQRCGVHVAVREWRGGDETTQAHAALAGLGRTRQILLSDTLVDTLRDEEIEVVVAHEIGHHVHGDVWRAAAWRLVALPLMIGVAALVTRASRRAGGRVADLSRDPTPSWPRRQTSCRGCRCSPRPSSWRTVSSSRSGWRCRAAASCVPMPMRCA